MSDSSVKITVHLCVFREADGHLCGNSAKWKIQNEEERHIKVCDAHLAWAIRESGLPARVDNFPPVA